MLSLGSAGIALSRLLVVALLHHLSNPPEAMVRLIRVRQRWMAPIAERHDVDG